MYGLMFAVAIRLRYSHSKVQRAYKIPYEHKGMWLVPGMGLTSSLLAFLLSFVPPSGLLIGNLLFYELFLIGSVISMVSTPLIIYRFKKPKWYKPKEDILNEKR